MSEPALDPDVWVPIQLRWRMIRAGDVIAGHEGKLFPVTSSTGTPNGEWVLTMLGVPTSFTGDPDDVAQVLEQVPMYDAMRTARDVLGARVIDRRRSGEAGEAA